MHTLTTDILVVGGGTGGTAAAIQAARRGRDQATQVILVSEYSWLGGMLTAAGVSAPDGNELEALQTGLWGQFLRAVQQRQPGGVDHGWVSCFTYDPRVGANILAAWAAALPNLHWIVGQRPRAVTQQGDRLTSVTFDDFHIQATIILDGTELGDVLALADVPHHWGWDEPSDEPSALPCPHILSQKYPVQLPTWVVVMQAFGCPAPKILPTPLDANTDFSGAWEGYGPEQFLNYGRLPGDRFMINWPQQGNDYGVDLNRLIQSDSTRQDFLQAARWHSQAFARYIQTQLGTSYGLATDMFPTDSNSLGGGAFALHPYYRESRRLVGSVTVREADILPQLGGCVAQLPVNDVGEMEAIALGNYANDHHYPAPESQWLRLAPKSMYWGGRLTGTPFALPYRCLIPATVDGLLVCEKNISVSHIANGATRLQPLVMNLGQAAGMAAALCIEARCQPRSLAVRSLQDALLTDAIAPAAIIPLLNLGPDHPDWLRWQRHYLKKGDGPKDGIVPRIPLKSVTRLHPSTCDDNSLKLITGCFHRTDGPRYSLKLSTTVDLAEQESIPLITLSPAVNSFFQQLLDGILVTVTGYWNAAGPWLRVTDVMLVD